VQKLATRERLLFATAGGFALIAPAVSWASQGPLLRSTARVPFEAGLDLDGNLTGPTPAAGGGLRVLLVVVGTALVMLAIVGRGRSRALGMTCLATAAGTAVLIWENTSQHVASSRPFVAHSDPGVGLMLALLSLVALTAGAVQIFARRTTG
jgi:hypothetical protein